MERYKRDKVYLRAVVAIFSSILFWVGAWDIATSGRLVLSVGGDGDSNTLYGIEFLIGVLLCLIASSMQANAALPAPTLFPECSSGPVLFGRLLFAAPGTGN